MDWLHTIIALYLLSLMAGAGALAFASYDTIKRRYRFWRDRRNYNKHPMKG